VKVFHTKSHFLWKTFTSVNHPPWSIMMICGFKTDSRSILSLLKRDIYGISSREMINIRKLYQAMVIVISGRSILRRNHRMTKYRRKMIRFMICDLYCDILSQLYFEHVIPPRPPILTTVKTQLRRRPNTSREVSSFITSDIYVEKMQYIGLALFRWKFWYLKYWLFITSLWNMQIEDIMSINSNYLFGHGKIRRIYMHRFVVTAECWVIDASYHLWMFVTHVLTKPILLHAN
jgi:hypothetical protein